MRRSFAYYILVMSVFLWCWMLILPPLMAAIEFPAHSISRPVYKFYSTICHQYETHSLFLFGFKLAVCARCFGIYIGFFIGCVLCPLILKRRYLEDVSWWIIIGFPVLIDVVLDFVRIYESTLTTRLITGLWFGAGAAIILTPIIIEAISEIISKKFLIKGVKYEPKT